MLVCRRLIILFVRVSNGEKWKDGDFMNSKKYSILYPKNDASYQVISQVTMHDLGLDLICKELSSKEPEQKYIMNVLAKMYTDPQVTAYRAEVFEDVLSNQKLREDMVEILGKISFLHEYGGFKRDFDDSATIWDLMHRLDELHDYIKCVEALHACLKEQEIHSEGFLGLKEYVEQIYRDNGFGDLKKDILNLKASTSDLKSITVGINLNDRFEADGIGLISVNSKQFTKSNLLSNFCDHLASKDKIRDGCEWKEEYKFQPFEAPDSLLFNAQRFSVFHIPDGDMAKDVTRYTDRIVNHMISRLVKHLRDTLNQYVSVTITDMTDLIPELMYYIRWAEYIEKLRGQGAVFSKPVVHTQEGGECEADDFYMKARGIYNIKLAAFDTEEAGQIVTNDLDFDNEHRVYILTGANRGGKTTITQAIGQLFVLAQGGIYIPGESFEFSPVDGIYTHFPADEDKTLDLGRLGEECKRFKEMYDAATKKSLMLLNETFSTTSFEEGYYIAKDSVRAILAKGIRTIYNTHMHKLAFDIEDMNEEQTSGKAFSLVIHNEGAQRSYKVEIAPPVGKSYASDIAKKYGVTYELLVDGVD